MTDSDLAPLLREIRDLQQQLLASHQAAVANQREAIDRQRKAVRRTLPLLILVIFLLAYGPWLFQWLKYLLAR